MVGTLRVFFVRHAESVANVQHRLASQLDVELSDRGLRQAESLARGLRRRVELGAIVASPLLRAQQTAQAFSSEYGLPVATRAELTEQQLGRYSGMTYEQIANEPDYCHDRSARWQWVPEGGGESYQMIAERLRPFFEWLESGEAPDRLLVVTHAVTLRIIRGFLENTLPRYPHEIAGNGEVWQVDYRGLGISHRIDTISVPEGTVIEHGE